MSNTPKEMECTSKYVRYTVVYAQTYPTNSETDLQQVCTLFAQLISTTTLFPVLFVTMSAKLNETKLVEGVKSFLRKRLNVPQNHFQLLAYFAFCCCL